MRVNSIQINIILVLIFCTQNALALIGGTHSQAPYALKKAIAYSDSLGCMAVAVAKKTLMTSAHCLINKFEITTDGKYEVKVFDNLEFKDSNLKTFTIKIKSTWVDENARIPVINSDRLTYFDIALIYTQDKLPLSTITVSQRPLKPGDEYYLSGSGCETERGPAPSPLKSSIKQINELNDFSAISTASDNLKNGEIAETYSLLCSGDSGGAVVRKTWWGGLRLIGINSHSLGFLTVDENNQATDVSENTSSHWTRLDKLQNGASILKPRP